MMNDAFGTRGLLPDPPDRAAILREIRTLARSYVPEWKMREDFQEPGSVLALLFADMQGKTLQQYGKLGEKFEREFYNMTGAGQRPAEPAQGYVCFTHTGGMGGVLLPEGTELSTGWLMENGMPVPVTTKEDLYVSGLMPEIICYAAGREDRWYRLYERQEDGELGEIRMPEGERGDLQEHVLRLYHPTLLAGSGRCVVTVTSGEERDRDLLRETEFFYPSEQGPVRYEREIDADGRILLRRPPEAPPPVAGNRTLGDGTTLCCGQLQLRPARQREETYLKELLLGGFCPACAPDHVFAGGAEADGPVVEPFGRRFSLFDTVTLFSEDVLSKKSAEIRLRFQLRFAEENAVLEKDATKWKMIMRKGDLQPVEEYDISIQRVLWEYFNGTGWVSLPGCRTYAALFRGEAEGDYRSVEVRFPCPEDIAPVSADGGEGYAIRVRIAEINNAFRVNGHFLYPVLKDIRMSYQYTTPCTPWAADGAQNGNEYDDASRQGGYLLFAPLERRHHCFYLGFSEPLPQGGLQMLLHMERERRQALPHLRYFYGTEKGFREMDCIDGTENLKKTGLLSFPRLEGQKKMTRFGKRLFWVLAEDTDDGYRRPGGPDFPVIHRIYPDAVLAETVKRGREESFTNGAQTLSPTLSLLHGDVRQAEVFVSEKDDLPKQVYQTLEEAGRLRKAEERGRVFVRWEERERFSGAGSEDRIYVLDRKNGTIRFGDGVEGRLLPYDTENGIYVRYDTGGGTACNLAAYEVTGMEYTVPEIAGAFNPLPFYGAADAETVEQTMERTGAALYSAGRYVSCRDFELAARSVGPYVKHAVCFRGRNEQGEREPGVITVLVTLENSVDAPRLFEHFKEKFLALAAQHADLSVLAGNRLRVATPDFLEIEIRADILTDDYHKTYGLQKELKAVLDDYVSRMVAPGRLPQKHDILMKLQSVKDVLEIRNLTVSLKTVGRENQREMNLKAAAALPYAVLLKGEYLFNIKTTWQE